MTITRRKAREWAVQMLAAADLNPLDRDEKAFLEDFWGEISTMEEAEGGTDGQEVRGKMRQFAEERFLGAYIMRDALDAKLQPFLEGWEIWRLGTVERAVLRLGAWELVATEIPTPIVINEAVDLANWYATPKSRLLVNGVLDKFAKSLEPGRSERVKASMESGGEGRAPRRGRKEGAK